MATEKRNIVENCTISLEYCNQPDLFSTHVL